MQLYCKIWEIVDTTIRISNIDFMQLKYISLNTAITMGYLYLPFSWSKYSRWLNEETLWIATNPQTARAYILILLSK